MTVNPIRDGFRAITPYLLIADATRLIDFVTAAFNGELLGRETRPDGTTMHAEMRVGDSMLMLGEASDRPPMPSSIYLYVQDCDAVYQRALAAGGVSIFEMMNLPSGERYGGVQDPSGNIWWIATHVEDVAPEEQARRWANFRT